MEPSEDYKVEPIDMDTESSYESGDTTDTDSSLMLTPKTVPQKLKRQRTRTKHSEPLLEDTVNKIRTRVLTMNDAVQLTGIPRTTLQYRLGPKCQHKTAPGALKIFTPEEENEMADAIKHMERKGFLITRSRLVFMVSCYLRAHPRKNSFVDNKPGTEWIRGFIKRNPDLNIKKQPIKDVTEADVRNWFGSVRSYLEDNQLADILEDPSRILIINDAGFKQSWKKEIVEKHQSKNVSFIDTSRGDHNVTVTFTFPADGSSIPPYVILPATRLSPEMKQSFPNDWGLGTSTNGWQDERSFSIYITEVLHPTLTKRGTQFPVLCFVDESDATFEFADWCKQRGIILIALYSNAMQIYRRSEFNWLKTTWHSIVGAWRVDHKSERMTWSIFSSLLKEAMDKSLDKSLIMKGFNTCGLYPLSPDAINFKKYSDVFVAAHPTCDNNGILSTTEDITNDTEEMTCPSIDILDTKDEETDRQIFVPRSVLRTALSTLDSLKIDLYRATPPDDLTKEEKVLSYVYDNILVLAESQAQDAVLESANNPITQEGEVTKPSNHDSLAFEVVMEIKAENDSGELIGDSDKTTNKVCGKSLENCQQNEINFNRVRKSSSAEECFAQEHICSFPRITTHFCPIASMVKYNSCFLDLTAMYMAYLDACHKSSQTPVTGKVYYELLMDERATDPSLPSRCDACQHVEKLDLDEVSSEFFNT